MTESPYLLDALRDVTPHAIAFDAGRYLVGATAVAALVWLLDRTAWRSRRIQARRATPGDVRRELLLSLRSVLIFGTVGAFTVWAIRNGWFPRVDGAMSPAGSTLLLAAMILAHDAYFYWTHRAMHHPRLFRSFHRLHHRSVTPTPFAAYAFAVPEALVMVAFMPLWLALVATPDIVTFVFMIVQVLRNVMGHAGMELHARGWADHPVLKWVSTTTHHDLHHSGGFNGNFGFYFTFWDKLMGTELPHYVEVYRQVTGTAPHGTALRARPAAAN